MDYLTVKEAAELKGCSVQYIKKLCKDGAIQAEVKPHPQNKQPCYMIPVSALPEELKGKYYKRLKAEAGTAPELKETEELKPRKKVVKKAFEEYTAEERAEIALWCKILREWQDRRIKYKNKATFDSDYVGKCRIEYGESIEISVDILYRKYAAFRENNYDGLIDKRGGWNKGLTSMNDEVWKMFTRIYLVSSRPTLSRCYTDIKAWTKTYYPELYCSLPSERTFRRRVDMIPKCVVEFTRFGKKACFDKYLEYIERDYTDLNANDIWIADNHTLDVISMSPEGKPHRLSLTAYMDAKSGVIVGWNLCDNPCSQSTLLAFRAAVMNGFGVPLGVYFDNGSEFLTHDIAGRGHRKKANWNKGDDPPTILSLLGVTMTNALVKNAKAKNIERYFYTFKEFISKAFSGYSGGTIMERPEDHAQRVKNGDIPTDEEIAELLGVLINGGYNCKAYGGKEKRYSGMSRIDVWNESINSEEVIFRDAADEDLTLLMARTSRYQKVHRNGVYIEQYGKKIWFKDDSTVFNVGKEVYVRFDPAELDEVRVYDRETDKYLWTYKRADYLNIPYLKKGDASSSTAQWKMQMLAQLGALDKANLKTIAEYAGIAPEMLTEVLESAALTAIEEFEPGFRELARDGIAKDTDVPIEETMERALKTYRKQAHSDMNLVNTVMLFKAKSTAQKVINNTAELADKQSFLNMSNYNTDYYGVLRAAKEVGTPAVLLEHGFHTNRANTAFLLKDSNLRKLATAEAQVIANYFGIKKIAQTAPKSPSASFTPYTVKVICNSLNIRKTPNWNDSDVVGVIRGGGVYTIVAETMLGSTKFGKLKSGAGWISLGTKYVKKLS